MEEIFVDIVMKVCSCFIRVPLGHVLSFRIQMEPPLLYFPWFVKMPISRTLMHVVKCCTLLCSSLAFELLSKAKIWLLCVVGRKQIFTKLNQNKKFDWINSLIKFSLHNETDTIFFFLPESFQKVFYRSQMDFNEFVFCCIK